MRTTLTTLVALSSALACFSAAAQQFQIDQCQQIERDSDSKSAERAVDPAGWVRNLASTKSVVIDETKVSVRLAKGPKYGKLRTETAGNGYTFFAYDPAPGFLGRETVSFDATYAGKNFRVNSTLVVVVHADEREDQKICPPERMRKIDAPSKQ